MSWPLGLSRNCDLRATLRKTGVSPKERVKAKIKVIQLVFKGVLPGQVGLRALGITKAS